MSSPLCPTIGLEVHVQLATRTRLFSRGPVPGSEGANDAPIDAVAAGHPGTLPVLNDGAVRLAVTAALALGCTVHTDSRFDRKHYFWPDLPKGFQVTQERHPLATDGVLTVSVKGRLRDFRVERVHMEEDAGSMRHRDGVTLVDLARCGVPLVEVVGAPDIDSPATAEAWARMLHRTLVAAGVTRGRMERGELRIDANVSLAPRGQPMGPRVEIKNLNSFRFLRRALDREIARQRALIANGGQVAHETRRWTGRKLETMRAKEQGRDYAWLPEPDLPVLRLDRGEREQARDHLPAVPLSAWLLRQDALLHQALAGAAPGLSLQETRILAVLEPLRAWVLRVAAELGSDQATVAGRFAVHDLRFMDDLGLLRAEHLVDVTRRVCDHSASHEQALNALRAAARTGAVPAWRDDADIGMGQAIQDAIDRVLAAHPGHEARWRDGNQGMLGFFMGRLTTGRIANIDRRRVHDLLLARLQARAEQG
ncbi:MAG: Asp-tRNA(Asn)/Glu-tRNA(Gln) amidotransferase subunit GatB [Oligoflexia bacterium]|nr:Asp-tRNA(Asn)/Glu-tRNA(Gln) amidotransferase subunit GatB [Oligoflexia bacterium]